MKKCIEFSILAQSKLNPNAKEFRLNPDAKEFVPTFGPGPNSMVQSPPSQTPQPAPPPMMVPPTSPPVLQQQPNVAAWGGQGPAGAISAMPQMQSYQIAAGPQHMVYTSNMSSQQQAALNSPAPPMPQVQLRGPPPQLRHPAPPRGKSKSFIFTFQCSP